MFGITRLLIIVGLLAVSLRNIRGNQSDSLVIVEDHFADDAAGPPMSNAPQELKATTNIDRHMVVLTMDGSLHCVGQRTGSLLWKVKEEPLINVNQENFKEFLLIPNPKDGSLFAYDGNQLTKYPFSIPQLVALSPSRTANGYLYAGSKRDVWIAINMTTGEKVEAISLEKGFEKMCPVQAGHPEDVSEVAYVGRSEYNLGVFDSSLRQKKWAGSYIDYSSHATVDVQDYTLRHLATSQGGLLATADDTTGDLLWQRDFGSPVAGVFIWDAAGLQRVPFTTFVPDALNLLVNPRDSILKELTFRQRTMLLKPTIQPILFVGSSGYGTFTMPTLGILEDSQKLLPNDAKTILSGGSVLVADSPQNMPNTPEEEKTGSYIQGYYTMPDKTTEVAPFFPAHGDLLFQQMQNQHHRPRLPGPSPGDTEPDGDHLAWFVFYLSSTVIAVLIAVSVSFYVHRRKKGDVSSSSAQTVRGQILNSVDESGRRIYHVGKLQFFPDSILGYGSAGTIVYEGNFDGRRVAVKRLVPELCGLAEKEAQLLRLSDKHSNVIRYFLTERDSHFCYLALELAAGTLADYVEGKLAGTCPLTPLAIIEQALHGLQHLHSLGIVHRDLKPANVLISLPETKTAKFRAVISDFGMCKRISGTSSWVAKSSSMGRTIGGTEGWIAPEILLRNFGGGGGGDASMLDGKSPHVTPAVDIFSAGCLIYYALTNGKHPFGEPLRRQVNIQSGKADFFELVHLGNHTAKDLCEWMVTFEPQKRPSVNECLVHPMFWLAGKQLSFLLDVSDRLEKVQPGDGCPALTNLERGSSYIVNHDWRRHVGDELQAELRTHRSYRGNSVRDLLRAIRNKKHHYQELPEPVKASLGEIPDGFLTYFTGRFPRLLIHVYRSASCIGDEPPLTGYYCKIPSPKHSSSDTIINHHVVTPVPIRDVSPKPVPTIINNNNTTDNSNNNHETTPTTTFAVINNNKGTEQ